MGYRDALDHGETNVGLGMVPHKKNCRCNECELDRLQSENTSLRAELANLHRQVLVRTEDMPTNAKLFWKGVASNKYWLLSEPGWSKPVLEPCQDKNDPCPNILGPTTLAIVEPPE